MVLGEQQQQQQQQYYGGGAAYSAGGPVAGGAYAVPGAYAPGVESGAVAAYGGAYDERVIAEGGFPPVPADAVVHSTSCATAGCVSAGCASGGAAKMNLVGPGNGDYIMETTYTYVGQGRGSLAVVTPRSFLWGRILALVAVVGAVGAAAVMLTRPQDEPEVQKSAHVEPPTEMMTCTYWGDPHIQTFDGGRPSFYGNGEYYIVKSESVKIQGRYMGTKYTAGLAATNKVAVSGPIMGGHTLMVGSMEDGPITIDGVPVLTSFPSSRTIEGVGEVTYTSDGTLVDQATAQWDKKVVKLSLDHFQIEVFRWSNYVDLRIQMLRDPDMEVDGGCGNMNNDPSDDTTEAIFNRVGARVPEGELLFHARTSEELSEVEEKLLTMCEPTKLLTAQKECKTALADWEVNPATSVQKSCLLDVCYGSNEHTLRMAKSLGLVPADSAAMATH